jgi:general secretion pathway protein D
MKPCWSILVPGTLFLASGLWAQVPAPSTQPQQPRVAPAIPAPTPNPAAPNPVQPGTAGTTDNYPRSTPRPTATPKRNSIIAPSETDTNVETIVIEPRAGVTNAPEEMIPPGTIDFRGADLNQVLELYAMLRQRTILRAANLASPTFVLKTQTPLTKSEAIKALDAMLGLNGIAIVDVGDKFAKAAPSASAGQMGAPFNTARGSQLPEMGQYVTHVIQLKYVKPSAMLAVLQPFASAIANPILTIDDSQILVLRDFTENVKRMLQMVEEVDVAIPSEFVSEVIPIKYAKATEIASALNSLSSGGGGAATVGGGTSTRSLTGTRSTGGFGRTGTGAGYGSSGTSSPFGTQPPGMATPQATANPAGGNSFTDRLRGIINRAANAGEIVVFGQTKMIADERTNSLLIYASHDDMKTIKEIIAKLDVVLAQVLIEAVIIEVTLNNNRDIGFSYIQGQPQGIGNYFKGIGAINNGNALSQGSFGAIGAATTNALSLPGGFSYLANLGNNDLDITLTALQSDSRAKILQRPRIQTSHNEPANLFVGESRPYPSGSYYGGGSFGGYSSIQAVNIGVTLEVTPLINPDGLVVMDIHQTIESANGSVIIANVGEVPITSRKEAAAKVSVRDHDTIILGGLIETSKTKSASGVPFLMNVPLVGYLFRTTSDKETRNELIVLIRPTVLPTPEVAALTARAEKDKMPGVKRAETEIQTEEANRLKQLDKNLKSDRELNTK